MSQVALQCACGLVDGHLVIVQNHKQIALAIACVVQTLECQTSRHSTIADDGYNVTILARKFGRLSHSVCGRD